MSTRVLVIPCSGIGKAYGTIGRDAALQVVEELRPETTTTMCLSLLVMGDAAAQALLQNTPAVTIDGCALACARKNVAMAGGTVGRAIMVLDVYRQHRDLKTQAVTVLDENGRALAGFVAEDVVKAVDALATDALANEGDDAHA
jgi:uncharacterized metal-binding protein